MTYILLLRNGDFPGSNEREEAENDRRGREALRIFLFLLAGGHIPTFGAGEGPLSF
jgi:hypothetical protein